MNRSSAAGLLSALAVIALAVPWPFTTVTAEPAAPLGLLTARVSLAGSSNVHEYTASTTDVRVTRVQVAAPVTAGWDKVLKPGAVQTFEVAIAAASLTSRKEGLDKNMRKALKVQEHRDITFRLLRFEGTPAALKAVGVLQIAGVEREVTLPITTGREDNTLVVKGTLPLLMTDYGIKPPTAMLGMLKTDPKVTVTFEVVLAAVLT